MKRLWTIVFLLSSHFSIAQTARSSIYKGNDYYLQKQFQKAAGEYNRALETEPGNLTAKFNLGNAFFRQDNRVDAAQVFNGIINSTQERAILNKAYYNKGVILSRQENLEASIEAYKNALRNNPDDKEARENLQKALMELKKRTPPPPKKKEDQKKKQQQQQQKQQPQSKLSPKETEQRLKLLNQKEKEVQERVQSQRSKMGASSKKDW